jgi:hypothetical protein
MSTDRRAVRQLLLAFAGIAMMSIVHTPAAYAAGNAGAIGFSAPGYSASVPDGVAVVVVDRTDGSSGDAAVTFLTPGVGAGVGTLSWSDGDATPRAIMVPISAMGSGGAFSVVLSSVTGASFGPVIQTTVSVMPASPPPPGAGEVEFSQSSYTTTGGAAALVVTVDRVQGTSGPAFATYTTVDGSAVSGTDYAASGGMLIWEDGDSLPKSFIVPLAPQAVAGHAFSLSLLSVQGAIFGANMNATVHIAAVPTVTASWSPPTVNTDGTALTNLAGYYVCIGGAGNQPAQTIQITNPAVTSISFPNIGAGTYYLAVMAYNSSGAISPPAGPVSTIVQSALP